MLSSPKVKRACGPENEARFGDESNKTRGGSSMADMFSPHCCYFSSLQDKSGVHVLHVAVHMH